MNKKYEIAILDQVGYHHTNLYKPWVESSDHKINILEGYDSSYCFPDSLELIVTAQHYEEPEVGLIRKAVEQNIPTLILADGVLEYNNIWNNPQTTPGCVFQPVLGHKIAVIGRSQKRVLEAWGNVGKCEVIGLPRLDQYLKRKPRVRQPNEDFKILIMTGKNPGYMDEQIEQVTRGLVDLRNWFEHNTNFEGLKIVPVWRIADSIAKEIGVGSQISDLSGQELFRVLQEVDALITAPSTAILEGLLQGIPVALLNYSNLPQYVIPSWSINCQSQIANVIRELIWPPEPKMLFQDSVLHDSLECHSPSVPRMHVLIDRMVHIGRSFRDIQKEVNFPSSILQSENSNYHLPEEKFDMQKLYPEHPVFSEMDKLKLQIKVQHLDRWRKKAEVEIQNLREDNNRLEKVVEGMKESRFWQLRDNWFALKRLLSLTQER